MAELFDCSVDNVALHLKNIYSEGELKENRTSEESSVVQIEGGRRVNRPTVLYNLDAIISVGYRVNSLRGTQFRIWATKKLKEYIVKGFVMDDERLAEGGVKKAYFKEWEDLSFAELQSVEQRVMYMKDWIQKLDNFLILNEKEILQDAGSVSHLEMEKKVREELEKYNQKKIKDKNKTNYEN